jgi:hypothetical protein
MTLDELCEKLGLENPNTLDRQELSKRHSASYPRASGRTTAMLLDVMMEIQKGHEVVLVAANYEHVQWLSMKLAEWFKKTGLDHNLVKVIPLAAEKEYMRGRRVEWRYDHYTYEYHSRVKSPYHKWEGIIKGIEVDGEAISPTFAEYGED